MALFWQSDSDDDSTDDNKKDFKDKMDFFQKIGKFR